MPSPARSCSIARSSCSIGYAACHWCHVMERESFEDEATARILNDGFVAIKVDREERPDLDSIYMGAVQIDDGERRLADVGLPDARRRAVLRRDVLPGSAADTGCRRSARCSRACRRPGREQRGEVLAAGQRLVGALVEGAAVGPSEDGAGHRSRVLRGGRWSARRAVRSGERLVGRRAQVPAADDAGVPAAADRFR